MGRTRGTPCWSRRGWRGAYTSLGNYADEEMLKLVKAASISLKVSQDDVLRWFGTKALPLLAAAYPVSLKSFKSTRPFLLTLNDVIHPEVRKIYPGADVPEFEFDTSSEKMLGVVYRSKRRMCALAEGLMKGAAEYFGEEALMKHTKCAQHGDLECRWDVWFKKRTS